MRPEPDPRPRPSTRSTDPRQSTRDRGQAIGLILVAIVLVGSIAIAVGLVGSRFHDRSTAQSAADAAALAGALDGPAAARDVAARNGATLVGYDETTSGVDVVVTVEVDVGGETAIARASTAP